MAVVTIDFIKKGKGERRGAKKNIRYMENRPGKDKAKIQRPLFTATGQVTRLQAYALIDQAEEGSTYFRVVISPDPVKENPAHDLPMREITKVVMDIEEIVGKPVTWVAAVQDDHTDIPHVHILAVARVRYLPAKPMIAKATKVSSQFFGERKTYHLVEAVLF